MPETAENITEKVKLDKCQDKRYLNKEKLPIKVFTKRNSPITDLLVENKHFKSFSQLAISLWFAMVLYSVVIDYSKEKRIYLGTRTLRAGFKNLHLGFLVWIGLFVSSLLVYLGFMVWAVRRIKYFRSRQYFIVQLWDVSWLSLFLLYYPGVLYYVARMVMVYDLGMATSIAVLMEGVRFLMKCYAFVRFNCPKYKKGVNDAVKPTFSHYLYFSFAPTLLYRDTYPRSTDAIRWRCTFKWFGEMFMGIMFYSIAFENSFKNSLEDYGIRKYTWIDIMVIISKNFHIGTILGLVFFFCGYHCYLNATAELLRFDDRLFYKDWWIFRSRDHYLRCWNVFIHDWLYTYVYKDLHENVFQKSKFIPRTLVLLLSAVVHDYIICVACRVFLPLFSISCALILLLPSKNNLSDYIRVAAWFFLGYLFTSHFVIWSMEYYATQNCPLHNPTIVDFITPRFLYC